MKKNVVRIDVKEKRFMFESRIKVVGKDAGYLDVKMPIECSSIMGAVNHCLDFIIALKDVDIEDIAIMTKEKDTEKFYKDVEELFND